jgi:tRNA U34 5-carboxymethylaminomethyl modifying enzyme MnmG/GidA
MTNEVCERPEQIAGRGAAGISTVYPDWSRRIIRSATPWNDLCRQPSKPTLETKNIRGLFRVGQINGTPAMRNGGMRSLCAIVSRFCAMKSRLYRSSEGYIGNLVDDIVTGLIEPSPFTSRAAYFGSTREDNADLRLASALFKLSKR